MGRVLFGLVKGAILGVAIGAAAYKLGVGGGVLAVVTYAIVGAVVGVLCGRPPWRQETFWTTLLKGIVGAVVGGALFFGARKLFGDAHPGFASGLGLADKPLVDLPLVLAPMVGALWGAFVEIDDSPSRSTLAAGKKA
jgi:hypothetical protein